MGFTVRDGSGGRCGGMTGFCLTAGGGDTSRKARGKSQRKPVSWPSAWYLYSRLLGAASVCQCWPVVQSPLAALLRKTTWHGASGCFILWLAALMPAGDLRVAVKRLVDGRQCGLLAEALAQAHKQWLRHG